MKLIYNDFILERGIYNLYITKRPDFLKKITQMHRILYINQLPIETLRYHVSDSCRSENTWDLTKNNPFPASPAIINSYSQMAFILHQLKKQKIIIPLSSELKKFWRKECQRTFFPSQSENYFNEIMFAIYSIPMEFHHINDVFSAIQDDWSEEQIKSKSLVKLLGKKMSIQIVQNWMEKHHPAELRKIPSIHPNHAPVLAYDYALTAIHYAFHSSAGKYESKEVIAKKIKTFRNNELKKAPTATNPNPRKLQVTISEHSYQVIKSISMALKITTSGAVDHITQHYMKAQSD